MVRVRGGGGVGGGMMMSCSTHPSRPLTRHRICSLAVSEIRLGPAADTCCLIREAYRSTSTSAAATASYYFLCGKLELILNRRRERRHKQYETVTPHGELG